MKTSTNLRQTKTTATKLAKHAADAYFADVFTVAAIAVLILMLILFLFLLTAK